MDELKKVAWVTSCRIWVDNKDRGLRLSVNTGLPRLAKALRFQYGYGNARDGRWVVTGVALPRVMEALGVPEDVVLAAEAYQSVHPLPGSPWTDDLRERQRGAMGALQKAITAALPGWWR